MGPLHSRLGRKTPRREESEDSQDAETVPGMRRAIEQAGRSSQLVKECFEVAQRRQLGREEIYVLLVYRALRELEDKNQMLERLKTRLVEYAIGDDPDGHL